MENKRHGTFSSSQNWKLTTLNKAKDDFGAPALKYIKQVQMEINLGRSINKETTARSTDWGNICEKYAFNLLDTDYQLISNHRLFHTTIKNYSGMPDLLKIKATGDIKSPYSLETFCDKIEALQKGIDEYKKEFPEDYWQHISNTILLRDNDIPIETFEAVIYVPYKKELDYIREQSIKYFGDKKYNWVLNANEDELPYLIDNGKYKNLNIFEFKVPDEDVAHLTEVIIKAQKLLINV
jgi:hypothetical protein